MNEGFAGSYEKRAALSGFTGCGKMRVFKKKAALSG
jgi:hypothetical protein